MPRNRFTDVSERVGAFIFKDLVVWSFFLGLWSLDDGRR